MVPPGEFNITNKHCLTVFFNTFSRVFVRSGMGLFVNTDVRCRHVYLVCVRLRVHVCARVCAHACVCDSRSTGVAAADYFSTKSSLLWHMCLSTIRLLTSAKGIGHEECGQPPVK